MDSNQPHRLTISSIVRLDGVLLRRESETTWLTPERARELLGAIGLEAVHLPPADEPDIAEPLQVERGRFAGYSERSQFATRRDRSKYAEVT